MYRERKRIVSIVNQAQVKRIASRQVRFFAQEQSEHSEPGTGETNCAKAGALLCTEAPSRVHSVRASTPCNYCCMLPEQPTTSALHTRSLYCLRSFKLRADPFASGAQRVLHQASPSSDHLRGIQGAMLPSHCSLYKAHACSTHARTRAHTHAHAHTLHILRTMGDWGGAVDGQQLIHGTVQQRCHAVRPHSEEDLRRAGVTG
eukprot:896978-Pelagomonas_calceolata.AAC.1